MNPPNHLINSHFPLSSPPAAAAVVDADHQLVRRGHADVLQFIDLINIRVRTYIGPCKQVDNTQWAALNSSIYCTVSIVRSTFSS